VVNFEHTRGRFEKYRRVLLNQNTLSFNAGLVEEVSTRLEQLDIVLTKIQALDEERVRYLTRKNTAGTTAKFLRSNALEVRTFAEAFYYFASRLRSILRHKDKPCPFLGSFECPGVREVRNLLIEHPEGKNSRAFTWSWTVGGPGGPALKVHREADEQAAPIDLGLNVNAQELCDKLDTVLEAALRRLGA
jgi:hypothetical protein